MRRRFTLALVGLVAGALLVSGAGVLLIARVNARNDAASQLREQAQLLAASAGQVHSLRVLAGATQVLRLENGTVLALSPSGSLVGALPAALTEADLDPGALAAGQDVSGWQGNLAFAAVPIRVARIRRELVVLLTRQVGNIAPGWAYFVLVSGGVLAAAAGIAAWMSRRITTPLVDASAATTRIAGGELGTRLSVASPIPELASLATSINQMAASLEAAEDRERALLLSVSHDLRTPLTSIRGYAEAIEEGVVDGDDARAAARVIGSESARLERLVADLLDLTRLRAHHLPLRLERVDCVDVARSVADSLRPAAAANGLRVICETGEASDSLTGVHPDAAFATADADRLSQVIGNLGQNAVGHARSAVIITVRPPTAGWVAIEVSDDGPGIPAQHLTRVFDRFYQVDRGDAARKGSGLGLAIVAELMRAMGGSVHAESPVLAAGGGTRMTVTLPADGPR